MKDCRWMLLAAIPGLMFCIIPIQGMSLRLSWQMASIWLAGIAFMALLSSWWWRAFFALALVQVMLMRPIITAYITLMMIAIFLGAAEGFRRMNAVHILNAMCIAGPLLTVWIVLQRIGLASSFSLGASSAGPFNIDAGGVFLALCLPAFFRRSYRMLIPVIVAGLILCRSTTAMIAALAVTAVWLVLSRPGWKVLAGGLIAAVLVGTVFLWRIDPLSHTMNFDRPHSRWLAWRHIVLSYRSAPWGRGLGSFAQLFPIMASGDPRLHETYETIGPDGSRMLNSKNGWWVQAHNEYLQVGFEMGLQAIVLLAAYLVFLSWRTWRRWHALAGLPAIILAGMAAVAVSCLGWHTFHIAPLALVGMAWIGMAEQIEN